MGKDVREVLGWPSSVLIEWQAYFVLQNEKPDEDLDEEEVEARVKNVLMPRPK